MGFKFVPNDRVFYVLEEWRGAFGNALLDDGPVGDALRHLRDLSLDRAAPPQAKKLASQTKTKLNEAIVAQRDADPDWWEASERVERLEALLYRSTKPVRSMARSVEIFVQGVMREWGKSEPARAASEAIGQLRIDWWHGFMPTVNGHRVTPQGMPSPELDFGELTIREPRSKGERDPKIKPPRPWNDPRPDPVGSPRTVVDHVLKGKSRNFNPLGLEGDYEPAFGYEDDDE
jgi:hypothetical protein